MQTIEIYRFDELSEDIQHKVHENAGYQENPWDRENWDTWRQFVKKVFPYVIKDWSYGYRDTWVTFYKNTWADMRGEELRDHLSSLLKSLGEDPTGYCMDSACYGYVRENLDKIVEKDMTAKDIAEDAFWNFCREVENEDTYCQSFEYFVEMAECNEWHYTADGQQVDV